VPVLPVFETVTTDSPFYVSERYSSFDVQSKDSSGVAESGAAVVWERFGKKGQSAKTAKGASLHRITVV
jgi:hypothetical protein